MNDPRNGNPGAGDAGAAEEGSRFDHTADADTPATRGSAEVMQAPSRGWCVYDWNDSGSSGYCIGIYATKREADAAARAWAAEYGRAVVL